MSRRYNSLRDRVIKATGCCCLAGFRSRFAHMTNEGAAEHLGVTSRTIQAWRTLAKDPDMWCAEHLKTLCPSAMTPVPHENLREVLHARVLQPRVSGGSKS